MTLLLYMYMLQVGVGFRSAIDFTYMYTDILVAVVMYTMCVHTCTCSYYHDNDRSIIELFNLCCSYSSVMLYN